MRDLTIPKPPYNDFEDDYVLEWIGEYADNIIYLRPTPEHNGAWHVYFNDNTAKVRSEVSFRHAVEQAITQFKKENDIE